jgi:hypothetical protein
MNKHVRILVDQYLSEQQLFDQTKEIIEEGLTSSAPDSEKFTYHITIGEFKKMKGFYGSKLVLRQLIATCVGRLISCYAQYNPSTLPKIISKIIEIFKLTDKAEEKAAEWLHIHFTKKYGPVSDERVKELDDIVMAWETQSLELIKKITDGGEISKETN